MPAQKLGSRAIALASQFDGTSGTLNLRLLPIPDVIIEDQRASGTNGGTAVVSTWTTRILNTLVRNTIGATLGANQFTLPAGTYYMESEGEHFKDTTATPGTNAYERIYNITDSAIAAGYASAGFNKAFSISFIESWAKCISVNPVVIAATKTFALQYYRTQSTDTADLGNFSGIGVDCYARVKIWKIS